MKYKLYQEVVLLSDITEKNLAKGDLASNDTYQSSLKFYLSDGALPYYIDLHRTKMIVY